MAELRGDRGVKQFLVRAGHPGGMPRPREALLEFRFVGTAVKVSAVDPETLTEVSIVGDPAAGEEALTRTALRKLDYVLRRARADTGTVPKTKDLSV